jgi:hypothetical protein
MHGTREIRWPALSVDGTTSQVLFGGDVPSTAEGGGATRPLRSQNSIWFRTNFMVTDEARARDFPATRDCFKLSRYSELFGV